MSSPNAADNTADNAPERDLGWCPVHEFGTRPIDAAATAETPPTVRFMMATKASHTLGDISRDKPDLALIRGEDGDNYIGEWVAGLGYVNVVFPKATTRELTPDEIAYYRTRVLDTPWGVQPVFVDGDSKAACCDLHNGNCEPPSELCCHDCTEVGHPYHLDGRPCVLPPACPAKVDADQEGMTFWQCLLRDGHDGDHQWPHPLAYSAWKRAQAAAPAVGEATADTTEAKP